MATAYLKRVIASNGSNITGTISAWVKRGDGLNSQSAVVGGQEGTDSNNRIFFGFWGDGELALQIVNGGTAYEQSSKAQYKDPNAWYHVVARLDTSNGVAQDRIQLFMNGDKITTYLNNSTFPSSVDIKLFENTTSCENIINARKSGSTYNNIRGGCVSHLHVIDGTAYDASTFGETDSTSGIWKIKTSPTVTYGTNGFNLKFEDRTNLDLDSGTNNFTNFTTVGTLTATYDNPSNNFATWNAVAIGAGFSGLSNGNTTLSLSDYSFNTRSSLAMPAGKWYWEVKGSSSTNIRVGVTTANSNSNLDPDDSSFFWGDAGNGGVYIGNTAVAASWQRTNNDTSVSIDSGPAIGGAADAIIMIALDVDAGKLWLGQDGVWCDSGDPAAGTDAWITLTNSSPDPLVAHAGFGTASARVNKTNFGNGYFGTDAVTSANADDAGIGAFEYDVPAGFYTLCTKNLKLQGG